MSGNNAVFDPKKGDTVAVCYDGKLGRYVKGKVLKRRGFAVLVKFDEWAGDTKNIEKWFVRITDWSFGGWVDVDKSLMRGFLGCPGDWYGVYHISELDKLNGN